MNLGRPLLWFRVALVLLWLSFLAYSLAIPLLSHWGNGSQVESIGLAGGLAGYEMPFAESLQLRTMEALAGMWFLFLGGTIGSFLNVVAYRMPRAKSVIVSPSACPHCTTRILARDNIPVLGWVLLKGKCRACGVPISPRYPMVEATVGAAFFLLFVVQWTTGGANIPIREIPQRTGISGIVFEANWELALLYFYHCALLSILFVWMLVDWDGQRIPWLARVISAAILWIPVLIVPFLLPVSWQGAAPTGSRSESLCTSVMGGLVGLTIGWLIRVWIVRRTSRMSEYVIPDDIHGHVVSGLALVGMALGWQAVVGVTLVTLAIRAVDTFITTWLGRRPLPMTFYLLIGFVLHHALWRWCFERLIDVGG